jgi:hypothetical protein
VASRLRAEPADAACGYYSDGEDALVYGAALS